MTPASINLDVAVFGAGIAGLWTLARLRRGGYCAALFERSAIGGIQSIASQGIIHGGTKYALTGKLTGSAQAIGEMPAIWRDCLAGSGEVDLADVRVLSRHQHLWTTGSLVSGMAGFFAGKVMQSRMQELNRNGYPAPFDSPAFRGALYRLQEPVLDMASLMRAFAKQYGDACYLLDQPASFKRNDQGWSIRAQSGLDIKARRIMFAAGRGNAALLQQLGHPEPAMQTRPLHMLMLRGALPGLYAHCLGASANPRLTVTSYPLADGRAVWYLGGQVAEEGVGRSRERQIEAGKRELAELLPWLDFSGTQWATLEIDRAEVAMPGGKRPDDVYIDETDGVLTCWPTKLAFAPRIAAKVLTTLGEPQGCAHDVSGIDLPAAPLAKPPWQSAMEWT